MITDRCSLFKGHDGKPGSDGIPGQQGDQVKRKLVVVNKRLLSSHALVAETYFS